MNAARLADAAERLAAFMALRCGWSPDRFWAATPREVAGVVALLLAPTDDAAADRAALDRLMETYPDG